MTAVTLRKSITADFDRIIQLNQVEVQQTSSVDFARLQFLDQISAYHKVALVNNHVVAFLDEHLSVTAQLLYKNYVIGAK